MPDPYLGEIRLFSCATAPRGWAPCNGQTLPTADHPELAQLLGATYGPLGSSFTLPDFRGRTMLQRDALRHPMGSGGGAEAVPLKSNFPSHTHALMACAREGTDHEPNDMVLAKVKDSEGKKVTYSKEMGPNTSLAGGTLESVGGGLPHNNMQPSLVINYCIALSGAYPAAD